MEILTVLFLTSSLHVIPTRATWGTLNVRNIDCVFSSAPVGKLKDQKNRATTAQQSTHIMAVSCFKSRLMTDEFMVPIGSAECKPGASYMEAPWIFRFYH